MNTTIVAFAMLTGIVAGALFAYLQVPIPAPPNLPGIMGIVGIYLGYKLVTWSGYSYDLLDALGV
jgi:XapX domain-containing protein